MKVDPKDWRKSQPWTIQDSMKLLPGMVVQREASINGVFKAGGINVAPKRTIKVFEEIRTLNGAKLTQSHSTGTTISIAAANYNRVQNLYGISTNVIATFSGNEDVPVFGKQIIISSMIGNKAFALVPWICSCENGEVMVDGDSASDQPVVATKAKQSGGSYQIVFGDIFEAFRTYEGSIVYRIDMTFDITGLMNLYASYYRNRIEEELENNAREVFLGWTVFGSPSTTITYDSGIFSAQFQHPADKVVPLLG
jgi:hypothetical protein